MKSLKEKIAVMQAALDGKEIEFISNLTSYWTEASAPAWEWNTYDYRIKPEPLEFWVNVYSSQPCKVYYDTKEQGEFFARNMPDYIKTIKVREVME